MTKKELIEKTLTDCGHLDEEQKNELRDLLGRILKSDGTTRPSCPQSDLDRADELMRKPAEEDAEEPSQNPIACPPISEAASRELADLEAIGQKTILDPYQSRRLSALRRQLR
jgi:hypothetical protein